MRKLLLLSLAGLATAEAATAQLQITQVRTRGSGGSGDEFVLVCNNTGATQDFSGFSIAGATSSVSLGSLASAGTGTVGGSTLLGPGDCYLFANNATSGYDDFPFATATYPLTSQIFTVVTPELPMPILRSFRITGFTAYTTDIADSGGYGLISPSFVVIDQVGFSPTTPYKEGNGQPLPSLSLNADITYIRIQETEENRADFVETVTTLPVELSSFTGVADGRTAKLTWVTESETDNAGFSIESLRGATWNEVAFVAGRGTTSERMRYEHRIDGLSAGTHTFRLVQRDLDGTATVAGTVEVAIGMDGALTVESRGRAVRVGAREAGHVTVEAFDVMGRRVAVLFDGDVAAGAMQEAQISGVAAGMYVVRATSGRAQETARVFVR